VAKAIEEAAQQRPATVPTRPQRGAPWLLPLTSLALLPVAWQLAFLLADDPRLMPGPARVLAVLVHELLHGELLFHLGATLARVAASFVVAMAIGIAFGILMGRLRRIDQLFGAWLVFFLNLPALVTIVLAYIWIGLDETAAITAVALNKIPNVTVTVREGARALNRDLLEMAQVFQIGRRRLLTEVVLPQLYPFIAGAARSGLALIWKIVLVVELLGRSSGVGFEIGVRFQLFDVAGILAYALAFIVIVQLIEWFVLQPFERRVTAWRR
jgi:NitT/TauT family transport system permease protein